MRMIFGLFAIMLLLGCLGGGPSPPVENNTSNVTNKTPPIKIIVGNQTNQTTTENVTEPEPEPEPEVPKDVQYEYDPAAIMGIFFFDMSGPAMHGDSILIKKGDLDILFDAGPVEKATEMVDKLKSRGIDDIDVLVSTSADPRKYGGMRTVAENYQIEEFWWSDDSLGDQEYSAIVNEISPKVKTIRTVEKGFSMELNGINLTALNPPSTRFDDKNNDAIVMRVTDRNFSALLMSNVQKGAHQKILNEQPDMIKNKVIQAPYYGVGEGTRDIGIFLITAKPEYMIITGSSDDSAANGGSREPFIRLLDQYEIKWNATYVNGSIRVTTDGTDYTVLALGKGQ
ncbi:MAG: MBL fold metallo-hydrolase [Nitrososphaera sp.]|nr:MBL fold metallo-hydrolase [Nitrososphaera sp.]